MISGKTWYCIQISKVGSDRRYAIDQRGNIESFIQYRFIWGHHVIVFDLETCKYGILKDVRNIGIKSRIFMLIKKIPSLFRVRIGTTLSKLHKQEMGVPQRRKMNVIKMLNDEFKKAFLWTILQLSAHCCNMSNAERQTVLKNYKICWQK